jgi:histidinol-phosphate aminotransferase
VSLPEPQPGILSITPYKGGESAVEGVATVRKLSSNESPIGPSPKAMEVYRALAADLHRYPDGAAAKLRHALAAMHGLDADRIVCSNGSDEMISLLCAAYVGPGDEVLYNQYGFAMYPLATLARGGTPVTAEETDYTISVDALLKKAGPKTKICFIANPNNPTGTYIPVEEVRRLRAGLPAHTILVLDGAYAEYVSRNDFSSGAELVERHDNVVMLRTFSKIYGLAGLRVGWTYMPPAMVDIINRVRGPFNVNAIAQAAAVAALQDTAWTTKARTLNDVWLPQVKAGLEALGLQVVPSVGNFLLIRFPAAPKDAAAADRFLRSKGLIVRPVASYGLPQFLRFTIGTEDDNKAFLAAVKEFLAS